MMAVKQPNSGEQVWLDGEGRPIEAGPRIALSEAAAGVSRRQQAMLAAAGEVAPDWRWYVLRVRPRCDEAVDNALSASPIDHWMPVEKRKVVVRVEGGGRTRVEKLFPAMRGYIFVHILPLPDHWQALKAIAGFAGVLGGMERPWPLKEKEFSEVRDFFGMSPKARRRELARRSVGLKQGDGVLVTRGAFEGQEGTYEGDAGDVAGWVLLTLFGGKVPVSVPLADMEKQD